MWFTFLPQKSRRGGEVREAEEFQESINDPPLALGNARSSLPGDTHLHPRNILGNKHSREEEKVGKMCRERNLYFIIPSPAYKLFILPFHKGEFAPTGEKLLSCQPVLVHVASIQFSHIFLTFSGHGNSPVVQKKLQLVLSGHGIQETSPGVC